MTPVGNMTHQNSLAMTPGWLNRRRMPLATSLAGFRLVRPWHQPLAHYTLARNVLAQLNRPMATLARHSIAVRRASMGYTPAAGRFLYLRKPSHKKAPRGTIVRAARVVPGNQVDITPTEWSEEIKPLYMPEDEWTLEPLTPYDTVPGPGESSRSVDRDIGYFPTSVASPVERQVPVEPGIRATGPERLVQFIHPTRLVRSEHQLRIRPIRETQINRPERLIELAPSTDSGHPGASTGERAAAPSDQAAPNVQLTQAATPQPSGPAPEPRSAWAVPEAAIPGSPEIQHGEREHKLAQRWAPRHTHFDADYIYTRAADMALTLRAHPPSEPEREQGALGSQSGEPVPRRAQPVKRNQYDTRAQQVVEPGSARPGDTGLPLVDLSAELLPGHPEQAAIQLEAKQANLADTTLEAQRASSEPTTTGPESVQATTADSTRKPQPPVYPGQLLAPFSQASPAYEAAEPRVSVPLPEMPPGSSSTQQVAGHPGLYRATTRWMQPAVLAAHRQRVFTSQYRPLGISPAVVVNRGGSARLWHTGASVSLPGRQPAPGAQTSVSRNRLEPSLVADAPVPAAVVTSHIPVDQEPRPDLNGSAVIVQTLRRSSGINPPSSVHTARRQPTYTSDLPPIVQPQAMFTRRHPSQPALWRDKASLAQDIPPTAAVEVLRHRDIRKPLAAKAAASIMPVLGPGEPLIPAIRHPLETIMHKNFAAVRLHTSPIAAELKAEAFTAGEHIVFAPGRMDLHTKPGISLLGHELAHVGQPLAFKTLPGESAESADLDEQSANQQERLIRTIIERGWPSAPRMELRQAARSLAAITESAGGSANRSAADSSQGLPDWLGALQTGVSPVGQGNLVAREVVDSRSSTPAQQGADSVEETGGGQDLNNLAVQVYDMIKTRLRAERNRHNVYSR